MVVLGCVYADMGVEIPRCFGCYGGNVCLVAVPPFQVRILVNFDL